MDAHLLIHPSLALVQPRKTPPYITERLLMGRKETNQTKQANTFTYKILNHCQKVNMRFSYHFLSFVMDPYFFSTKDKMFRFLYLV